ncbi:MAG TPA: nickel pincer cofactor biosynthesis protein LarB [Candidatus Coprocola pullicola]|nr:nickel pincer cofactor biosynthesis protein LarB [Candidatus Coprocola pullicola]
MQELKTILEQLKAGTLSIQETQKAIQHLYQNKEMDFATIDWQRSARKNYGEVIFCNGKKTQHLLSIFEAFAEKKQNVIGTRASEKQFALIQKSIPQAEYDPLSQIIKLIFTPVEKKGLVAVCTGGTSDVAVAEEAAQTAEFHGSHVLRIYDVGVAGIHRLFARLEEIRSANCIVAVAGMEGALGGVITGLVNKPVIAVPTSVGYGTAFHGVSALLTMLNSCAEGMAVVNIDNGFGAGYMASQINRLICAK